MAGGLHGVTQMVGRSMGRYLIRSVIGSGGFATVYRAVDTGLERPVALKVVDPAAHRNPTIGRRFLLEGRAVASLNHPAIVPVYDAGEDDGVLWLAMRLIEGASLDHFIAAGRPFSPQDVLAIIGRIGAGLDHAHARGVVHRDVKPSNILLEDNDPTRAWLTDFGIAATARTAGLYTTGALGTAAYMAPEQSRPSEVGPAADVYSLACVAYEMLAGRRPFQGEDYVALLLAHATEPVPPIGHPGLDELMARALAKQPDARPTSGIELADQLGQALAVDATQVGLTKANAVYIAPTGIGSTPTVVEPREHTLVYDRPVAPPTPPRHPPTRQPARPTRFNAPPAPPPGRDPTAARISRRKGRYRLLAGVLLLLVGLAAGGTALWELYRPSNLRLISDDAGASYKVPTSWTSSIDAAAGLVTWRRDGQTVAVVSHRPADDTDAVAVLVAERPALCSGDVQPTEETFTGAQSGAVCTNGDDSETATAAAAIADGKLWIVTLQRDVPGSQRKAVLDSLDFS